MAKRLIGIDFGTSSTYVKVKRYENGSPVDGGRLDFKSVIFDSGSGSAVLPTVVQTTGEDKMQHSWYGVDAEIMRPGGVVFRNFKVNLESQDPIKRAEARDLTKQIFLYLFQKYQEQRQFLGETEDEEETIVSYPAKWSEETQRFMIEAARQAGFPSVSGMDEATASIGAVLVQKKDEIEHLGFMKQKQPFLFLVVDMGAGTTDIAVCRYRPGTDIPNEIVATWPGENNPILFGGREIDSRLSGYFTELLKQEGVSETIAESFPVQQMDKVKEWKERTLSDTLNKGQTVTYCNFLMSFYSMLGISPPPFSMGRAELEGLMSSYLRQFPELIWGCLTETARKLPGFTQTDIEMVILTGGHSQWYFVHEMLSGVMTKYGDVRLPKITGDKRRLFVMPRPQEMVSLGLIYQPLIESRRDSSRSSSAEQKSVYSDFEKQRKNPEQMDTDELYHLACSFYENGVGQDYGKAVTYFTMAAEQGNVNAQSSLGALYYSGKGTAKDYFQAVKWFQKAAERGEANAQTSLGGMYEHGEGVPQDYTKAAHWYRKAAEQGNPIAQNNLGALYLEGHGMAQNDKQAAQWFQKAAEQGMDTAQYNLGTMYYNGQSVGQDYEQAAQWFRRAAEKGEPNAQCSLGSMYYNGQGVLQDYKQAAQWFRRAAEKGEPDAQCSLGTMYYDGQGVGQDYKQAAKWYQKAAEQGMDAAQYNLACMYYNGQGMAQDHRQAAKWYLKAAEQGNAIAQSNIGYLYECGEGVIQDYFQAVQWYRKGAEQGNRNAQYHLGLLYREGKGVEKDLEQAVLWMQKAADQGDTEAKKALMVIKFQSKFGL